MNVSGVVLSALPGKMENAPTASAANPNSIVVFICIIPLWRAVCRLQRKIDISFALGNWPLRVPVAAISV